MNHTAAAREHDGSLPDLMVTQIIYIAYTVIYNIIYDTSYWTTKKNQHVWCEILPGNSFIAILLLYSMGSLSSTKFY